jgi:hypothetical protein
MAVSKKETLFQRVQIRGISIFIKFHSPSYYTLPIKPPTSLESALVLKKEAIPPG